MLEHREVHSILCTCKKETENGETVTCKMKFIDSVNFRSSLADNPAEGLHRDYRDCKSDIEYITTKKHNNIQLCRLYQKLWKRV